MVKIIGTTQEVDEFMMRLVCPAEDNVGTLEDCPLNGNLENANCDQCLIDTYKLKLVYED